MGYSLISKALFAASIIQHPCQTYTGGGLLFEIGISVLRLLPHHLFLPVGLTLFFVYRGSQMDERVVQEADLDDIG